MRNVFNKLVINLLLISYCTTPDYHNQVIYIITQNMSCGFQQKNNL